MKRFKILYFLFIIVCVIYPYKTLTGPITFRHILGLLMLGLCIFEGFRSDKFLFFYYFFLLCFGVSSLITGYEDFLNKLLGTYIPIIAAYASTFLLIKKYSGADLFVWMFVGLGLFNAIITIGQFFHLGFVDSIYTGLNLDYNEMFTEKSDAHITLEGFVIPGLFGAVINGYFLSATALLVLYNKKGNLIINLTLWLIVMTASIIAQERSGFFLALLCSTFIIGKYLFEKGRNIGLVLSLLIVIVAMYFVVSNIDMLLSSDLRFAKGFNTDGRSEMRSRAWQYILNNPLGGAADFFAKGNRPPHNFFVNAFLFGGLGGGISLSIMLILQFVKIWPYLFRQQGSQYAQWAFIFGLMYIDFSLNSLFHNASIVHGTFMFFVWWGAFLGFAYLDEKEEKRIKAQPV